MRGCVRSWHVLFFCSYGRSHQKLTPDTRSRSQRSATVGFAVGVVFAGTHLQNHFPRRAESRTSAEQGGRGRNSQGPAWTPGRSPGRPAGRREAGGPHAPGAPTEETPAQNEGGHRRNLEGSRAFSTKRRSLVASPHGGYYDTPHGCFVLCAFLSFGLKLRHYGRNVVVMARKSIEKP